jgi:hypothetical protein
MTGESLEGKFASDLDIPGNVITGDLAEGGAAVAIGIDASELVIHVCVYPGGAAVIEGVEGFQSKLEPHSLAELEVLEQ